MKRLVLLPGVLLLDTIGELSGLFARGDVVFMGGTLVHRGGHNILEPAAFGRAVREAKLDLKDLARQLR